MSMTAPLAAPGARVITPPTTVVEQDIAKIQTTEDYEALMKSLGRK
jgi:hypothetical protein